MCECVPGQTDYHLQLLAHSSQAVARNGNKIESRNFMYKEISDVLGKVVFKWVGIYHSSIFAAWVWLYSFVCGARCTKHVLFSTQRDQWCAQVSAASFLDLALPFFDWAMKTHVCAHRNCGAFLRITTAGNLPHLVNMEALKNTHIDKTQTHKDTRRLTHKHTHTFAHKTGTVGHFCASPLPVTCLT